MGNAIINELLVLTVQMNACDFRAIYSDDGEFMLVNARDFFEELKENHPELNNITISETPLSMEEIRKQLEQSYISLTMQAFEEQYDKKANSAKPSFFDNINKDYDKIIAMNGEFERLEKAQADGKLLPISQQAIEYYATKGQLIREKLQEAGYDNIGYKQDIDSIPPKLFVVTKEEVLAALEAKHRIDREAGERFSIKTEIPSNRVEPTELEHSRSTGLQATGHVL